MRLAFLATSVLALTVSAASGDPITDRQNIMKERGAQMRVLGPIAQGKQPFDAAAVMAALQVLHENAQRTDVDALWAPGTDGGENDTKASAWEDMEGFKAAHAKYAADVEAAVAANPQDLAAFQAAFGPAASNCGSCHEEYRM